MSDWMIYGANGYTGRLVAQEARRRGLSPVLAGRNAGALEQLGHELGLPWRAFVLEQPDAVRNGLSGIDLVLHCAGPFAHTAAPMLEACLEVRAHYLDITGEIPVFAHCHAQHERAVAAGIVVAPGAGFDVVPTDCLAAQLKRAMPDAQRLVLAFEAGGGPSRGTALTSVEGLGQGGCIRRGGRLTRVPLAWKVRRFERGGQSRTAVSIPWGDVYTAHVSTGIPDIEVYMAVPPSTVQRLRRLRWLRPLLATRPVQSLLKRQVRQRLDGPDSSRREATGAFIWGEVENAAGQRLERRLATPNGYTLTALAALGMVESLRGRSGLAGGYYTPSQLMGADYVLALPGVTPEPVPA